MIEKIAIVGVGLIGGSLGLSWLKQNKQLEIIGFDNPDVLESALRVGAITRKATNLSDAVSEADVVVLAIPLRAVRETIDTISQLLRPGTIVTDVGSVKVPVLDYAQHILPESVSFIAGHPMAGSEKGGVENANVFLFENATYVLCPSGSESNEELSRSYSEFISLIQSTGARVIVMDAHRHDRIAASVSHLPQLLAVILMNYAASLNTDDDAFLRLAAGGFRDMTRIASSSFEMWRDIIVANEGPILDALSGFTTALQILRNRVAELNLEKLQHAFVNARTVRETIPKDTKGFLHPLSDVYVYAEDKPGELLTITQTLFDVGLNIKDIELLKIREGAGGAFRISFVDDVTADQAVIALKNANYTAYRL